MVKIWVTRKLPLDFSGVRGSVLACYFLVITSRSRRRDQEDLTDRLLNHSL